ncbi:MAG: hypothetical protein I8H94_00285 [Rhodobacteraceae bacterium]|nr:hypothetical protein [Paracoccaceae bacterium]
MAAETLALNNDLNKSAGLISAVYQFCGRTDEDRIRNIYGFSSHDRVRQGTGSVSDFDVTSHIYSLSRSPDGTVGLTISYDSSARNSSARENNCMAIIVFNNHSKKVKIKSAFSKGEYKSGFSAPEISELSRFYARCDNHGRDTFSRDPYGDFQLLDDGGMVRVPGRFDCAVAVPNNVSSVLVSFGKGKFRISAIHNHLFFEEVSK